MRPRRIVLSTLIAAAVSGCSGMSDVDRARSGKAGADASRSEGEARPADPNSPSVLEQVAYRALKGRNYVAAEALFRRSLEKGPGRRSARAGLADSLAYLGRKRDAITVYRRLLDENPDDPPLRARLGRTLLSVNEPRDALVHIERAMGGRENAEGLNDQGIAHQLMGRPEKAIRYFRRALDHKPGQPHIESNLAVALALADEHGEAERLLEKVVIRRSSHPAERMNLAIVRAMRQGRTPPGADLALLGTDAAANPVVIAAVAANDARFVVKSARGEPARGLPRGLVERENLHAAPDSVNGDPAWEEDARARARPMDRRRLRAAASPLSSPSPALRSGENVAVASAGGEEEPVGEAGVYRVQLGAFRSRDNAEAARAELLRAAADLVADMSVVPAPDGSRLFRLRTSRATSRAAAAALCSRLAERSFRCFVTRASGG